MKSHHSFVAERIAAQHCQELLRRRGPDPATLIPALSTLGERLAKKLAPELAALLGGDTPAITAIPAKEISKAELLEWIGPLAANTLLAGGIPRLGLISSIDGPTVLRLVDRAFGGRGEASGPLPDAFPLSAEMMVERLEALVLDCLSDAFNLPGLRTAARGTRLAELARFPAATRLVVLQLEVADGARNPWHLTLTVPVGQLPELIARAGAGSHMPAVPDSGDPPSAANPAATPFAEMPLPLTATLVEMQVPLSLLATIEPGVVLPVAVARAVPLSIGETVLARGTVGTQDDRVAIKLSQIA
ncbi:MAG: FliM/FliN family flagellar motor switch protein [Novosphingobium sp.]|nr:FliM/FliN family flagellar motor switch protein [Novosphingobium sp.]